LCSSPVSQNLPDQAADAADDIACRRPLPQLQPLLRDNTGLCSKLLFLKDPNSGAPVDSSPDLFH
jgi:hypothetical protein